MLYCGRPREDKAAATANYLVTESRKTKKNVRKIPPNFSTEAEVTSHFAQKRKTATIPFFILFVAALAAAERLSFWYSN